MLLSLRPRLPGGPAADDRRTVGGLDHAADRAGREPQTSRRADRATIARRAGRRTVSPTVCWEPADAPPSRCRLVLAEHEHAALPEAFAVQLVHRLRDQDPRITPALDLARPAPGGPGHDGRRGRARRASQTGRRERHRAQHHHQHAADLRRRLEGAVRAHQPRRRGARGRAATSGTWISRRAISIAAPSRSWRAARTARNSTSRAARSWRRSAPGLHARRRRTSVGAIRAITSLPAGGVRSRRRSAFGCRGATGRRA